MDLSERARRWVGRLLTAACLVSLVLPATTASARRAPTRLATLLGGAGPAAVVEVLSVDNDKLLGLRVARCKLIRRLRGLRGVERVAFVAQRLRSSDRSHAIKGERLLVFLSRPKTKRVRRAAKLLAAMVDSQHPYVLFRLAGAGDGRLPLSRRGSRWQASVGHLRLGKTLLPSLVRAGSKRLLPLSLLEKRLAKGKKGKKGKTSRRGAKP